MRKNLSKYVRHRILSLFNAGKSIIAISAVTGIREDKIQQVINGKIKSQCYGKK